MEKITQRNLKILVLDEGFPQNLLLLAALKSNSFDITLAEPLLEDSYFLQFYRKKIPTSYPELPEYGLLIKQLLEQENYDLILPNSENIMPVLWGLDSQLTAYLYPALNPSQRALITDRLTMYQAASDAGLKIIDFHIVNTVADLEAAFALLGFPLVLRGRQGLGGSQVVIVNNASEAHKALELVSEKSNGAPFVQRYVDGYRCLIGGICESGNVLTFFSQKTMESFPGPTGPSIRICSIQDEKLEHYFKLLIKALHWNGIACAEFICDANNDYFFLEMNPRPWAAISAAKSCGLDMIKAYTNFLAGIKEPLEQSFIEGKEVILFPAFFMAKASAGQTHTLLLHPIQAMKCLMGAPWRETRLMMYYFVNFYQWLQHGVKNKLVKFFKKLQK